MAALPVASTIVDISPFSRHGALMVASRPDAVDEEKLSEQIRGFSAIVVAAGPLLGWAATVVPGWA